MMNENSKTGNAFQYQGYAKVSFLRGKDVVKVQRISNNGTKKFFEILSTCLCGYDVSTLMPKCIDIGNTKQTEPSADVQSFETHLYSRVAVKADVVRHYQDEDIYAPVAAVFNAFIPSRNLGNFDPIDRLRLYNSFNGGDTDHLLAEIIIQEDHNKIQIKQSNEYSLMVEWVMVFDNVTTQLDKS